MANIKASALLTATVSTARARVSSSGSGWVCGDADGIDGDCGDTGGGTDVGVGDDMDAASDGAGVGTEDINDDAVFMAAPWSACRWP
ncbi:hypothetical protein [uncultured Bifidobacterium sp.]|uniref:hypothetical protein n=1 Tax=uncultured Bifidobacterium sp. TaxID=165187 RepID=UPI002595BB4B|nr:hypothetical protein [uncultured Bifidobacterium sp.]